MGCAGSRPSTHLDNFNTLEAGFIGGRTQEPNLAPIDALDFSFRDHLDTSQYGSWDEKVVKLDQNLELVEGEADAKSTKYVESIRAMGQRALTAEAMVQQKAAGIGKIDSKASMVGKKYSAEAVVEQLNRAAKTIEDDPKGYKNFPRQALKVVLENEYVADTIKKHQLASEADPKSFLKDTASLGFGALSQVISTLVAKAQQKSEEANSYNLPQAVLFIAGRLSEENYKAVMDMVEDYKKCKEMSGDERIELAKKTVMVFPGITKAFIQKESAMAYLNEPLATSDQLLKVLFKVQVDLQGDLRPMDIKKFLGDDPAAEGEHMSDALLQRLMVQVQSYSIEDETGKDIVPDSIVDELKKNGGKPALIPNIWTMTHIIHVRQLENKNDPNTSTNLLDANKKETWKALFDKEEAKLKETAGEVVPE